MIKLKNLVYRFFILFAFTGIVIFQTSCVEDQKDKDLIAIQTFFERHDGTQWTVIDHDMRIYLKFNQDRDKAIELWMSDLELAKLMAHRECFYYSNETLDTEEVTLLENSNSKLEFTYLDKETISFIRDDDRIKLVFETNDKTRAPIHFSKTTENLTKLNVCPDQKSESKFDWKFLK